MLQFTKTKNVGLKQGPNKYHLEFEKFAASLLLVVSSLMHVSNYQVLLKSALKNVAEKLSDSTKNGGEGTIKF